MYMLDTLGSCEVGAIITTFTKHIYDVVVTNFWLYCPPLALPLPLAYVPLLIVRPLLGRVVRNKEINK